jgi:PKD repeat protein
MMRRGLLHALVLAILLAMLGTHVSAAPQPGRVHFTAAGDFAARTDTAAVLNGINTVDSDLTLALGDLSYGTTGQEQAWCDFVTTRVGAGNPFELLSGNHESNGQNGNVNDFAACLPNQLPGVVGTYGRQYFVDVPADEPVARFILISPALPFPDSTWSYAAGSPRYNWTSQTIDAARTAQIPWVVVGMHKPCITVGQYTCEPGADLFNLLLSKKVDLILSGHEHGYMRSHQLGLGTGCATLVPDAFDTDCRVDNDDAFTQGRGSVVAVVGTGGIDLRDVNSADTEAGYFAATSGLNSNPTWGALNVTATPDSLQAAFLRGSGGSFADAFSITRNPAQNTPPVASFTQSCTNLSCNFNASGSSDPDGTISSYAWDFDDGTPAGTGASPSHTYAAAGTYTVRLTVTDNGGATGTTTRSVTVTAPPGPTTYASDQFTRTVSNGWGTASPTGGAWSVNGTAANYGVNGSAGTMVNPAGSGRLAYLAGISAPAAEALITFGLDKVANGSGTYLSTHARRITGQGSYAAKAQVTGTGSVTLALSRTNSAGAETVIQAATGIPGLTYTVGDKLTMRVQAVQTSPTTTTVRSKVWKTGTAEPAAWQRSITDSTAGLQTAGHVGFSSYVSSGATNGPITIAVDQLVVTAP